jgi:predicted XRE-type DNA-binding protein
MPQKVYHVQLSRRDRRQIETYVTHGQRAARAVTRARILLLADEHYRDEEIMEVLGVSRPTVAKMRRKYHDHQGGTVVELLQEAARPGQPVKVDSRLTAHVAGIACSEAPAGKAHWTLELIADRLVELKLVDTICRESVRQALKKMPSSPGCSNDGV